HTTGGKIGEREPGALVAGGEHVQAQVAFVQVERRLRVAPPRAGERLPVPGAGEKAAGELPDGGRPARPVGKPAGAKLPAGRLPPGDRLGERGERGRVRAAGLLDASDVAGRARAPPAGPAGEPARSRVLFDHAPCRP